MNKQTIIENIQCLIKSCEEGQSGDWDSSVPTGYDGFEAMIQQLEEVLEYIENN